MKKIAKHKLLILKVIALIDRLIEAQVNCILHHPKLQQLEASWRSLKKLTDFIAIYNTPLLKIKMLSLSKKAMAKDILNTTEFDQSHLFHLIYTQEFDHPGGEPYGLLIGDYYFAHNNLNAERIDDVSLLTELAKIAASSFSPFIAGAHSRLLGFNSFNELKPNSQLSNHFDHVEFQRWQKCRQLKDARFVGLTLPRVLVREPHQAFAEQCQQHEDYCWGNAAYAFALKVIASFGETGWFNQIRGWQQPVKLTSSHQLMPYATFACQTEIQLTCRQEKILSDLSLIPLFEQKLNQQSLFVSCQSLQSSKVYYKGSATTNARIATMLPTLFAACRFAQYVKIIMRDKVGSFIEAYNCEQYLQKWLLQYCAAPSMHQDNVYYKYPLREAKVKLRNIPGKPGSYYCHMHLQPHYQLDSIETSLQFKSQVKLS
jgi:type VI secretion system protein ImpD